MSAPQDRAGLIKVMAKGMIAPHLDITNYPGVVLDARNALAALEAAGLRVVPVEATIEQRMAVSNAIANTVVVSMHGDLELGSAVEDAVFRAMLAASPFAPQPQETTDAG